MDAKEKTDRLKRIIRNLKKEEIRIMQSILGVLDQSYPLTWNQFFDLKKPYKMQVKYNLNQLLDMNKDELQQVTEEFYSSLFNRFYKADTKTVHASLLQVLGLSNGADINDVKARFRELAKISHPDTGGTDEAFIKIHEAYEQLKKMEKK